MGNVHVTNNHTRIFVLYHLYDANMPQMKYPGICFQNSGDENPHKTRKYFKWTGILDEPGDYCPGSTFCRLICSMSQDFTLTLYWGAFPSGTQRNNIFMTSWNDIATSFWRNNDGIDNNAMCLLGCIAGGFKWIGSVFIVPKIPLTWKKLFLYPNDRQPITSVGLRLTGITKAQSGRFTCSPAHQH